MMGSTLFGPVDMGLLGSPSLISHFIIFSNDFGLYLDFFLINIVHFLFYIFNIQDLIYFAYFSRIQNKKIRLKIKVILIDKKIRVAGDGLIMCKIE